MNLHKYIAVREVHEETLYPISILCNLIKLTRSSYYAWLSREESSAEKLNGEIIKNMIKLYYEVDGIFGYRRMTMHINRIMEQNFNLKRIYRLMKLANMKSVIRKSAYHYKPSTPQITAENILNRDFKAEKPNQKWLTDVTEFKLTTGDKLFLSAILDLGDNSIVSYVMGTSNNNDLVFETFDIAVEMNPGAKPIFHSDRGFQYTNKTFKTKLDELELTQSMSRVGRCIDNGPMEGFWGIIKCEMYYLKKFHSYEELIDCINNYMEFYNFRRLQKRLNAMSPMEYRNQIEAA